MQSLALALFLIWAAIIVATFAFVARSGNSPGELPTKAYKRNRVLFLFFLLAFAGVSLILTLPDTPYPAEGVTPDRVIYVSGKQFAFKLSDKEISDKDAWDDEVFFTIKPIRKGELVEFRVKGADVTHGFSIYDRTGRVLTQTQAMPGYVNRLRYKFTESGIYPILCFEFCGIQHYSMKAQLEVVDGPDTKNAVASN